MGSCAVGTPEPNQPGPLTPRIFPSPSTIPFLLIMMMTLSFGFAASGGSGPVFIMFTVVVALIALNGFLLEPRRIADRFSARSLSVDYPDLARTITSWASDFSSTRMPGLLWSEDPGLTTPFVFGTFTRRYVLLPEHYVRILSRISDKDHCEELKAVLYHELAHVDSGDLWKAGLASWTVKAQGIVFLVVASVLLWSLMLYRIAPEAASYIVGQAPESVWLYALDTTPDRVFTTTPFSFDGADAGALMEWATRNVRYSVPGVLMLAFGLGSVGVTFYILLRALLRSRELHADAIAASALATPTPLRRALVRSALRINRSRIGAGQPHSLRSPAMLSGRIRGFLSFHPGLDERLRCLQDTSQMLTNQHLPVLMGAVIAIINVQSLNGLRGVFEGNPLGALVLPFLLAFICLYAFNKTQAAYCGYLGRRVSIGAALRPLVQLCISLLCVHYLWAIPAFLVVYQTNVWVSHPTFESSRTAFIRTQLFLPLVAFGVLLPVLVVWISLRTGSDAYKG